MTGTDRWLSLSSVLWTLLFEDLQVDRVGKDHDQDAFLSFLDLLEWRRDGRVNPPEFTVLYKEWKVSQCGFVTLDRFRELLRIHERHYNEANLALFVAFLIHDSQSIIMNGMSLQSRFVELTEDVFFSLDMRGHGGIGWDEVYFFSACVIMGTNAPTNNEALSIMNITAVAAQLTRDLQGGVAPRLHAREFPDERGDALTAPKFLRLMLSKEMNTAKLQALSRHLQRCADLVARLLYTSAGKDGDYCSLLEASLVRCGGTVAGGGGAGGMEEDKGWAAGPPCLWRRAVMSAAACTDATLPTIAVFLLSHANSALSVIVRGYPHMIPQRAVPSQNYSPHATSSSTNMTVDTDTGKDRDIDKDRWSIEDETHQAVLQLWMRYQHWEQHNRPNPRPRVAMTAAQHDPEYMLILAAVAGYKGLQLALSAALGHVSHHLLRSGIAQDVVEACRAVLPSDAQLIMSRMERLLCQQQTTIVRQVTRSPPRPHPRRQSPLSSPAAYVDLAACTSDCSDSVQVRRARLLKQLLDSDDDDVAHQQRLVAELRALGPDEYPALNDASRPQPQPSPSRQRRMHVHVHVPSPDASPAPLEVVDIGASADVERSETDHTRRRADNSPNESQTALFRAVAHVSAPSASVAKVDGAMDRVQWDDPVQQPSVAGSLDSMASQTELLAREVQVAKYAETLKDILKRMPSSADSKDQFKSLQKVMRLGYDIAKKERIEQDRCLTQQLLRAQIIVDSQDAVRGASNGPESDGGSLPRRDRKSAPPAIAASPTHVYHAHAAGSRWTPIAFADQQRPVSAGRVHRVRLGGQDVIIKPPGPPEPAQSQSQTQTQMSLARSLAEQQHAGPRHNKTSPYLRARNQIRTPYSDDGFVMFAPSPDFDDLKPGRSDSPTLTSRRTRTGESFTPRTTHAPSTSSSAVRVGLQLTRGGTADGAASSATVATGGRRHAVTVGGQRIRAPKKIFGHPL